MSPIKQFIKKSIQNISGYELQGIGNGSFAAARNNTDVSFFYPSTLHLMEKTDDEVEGTWKLYEHLCNLRVKTILDRYRIDVVIDVGANEGQFAADLRRKGYQGKIISFEPTSIAFDLLQQKAAADPNWEVKKLALGTENTEMTINIYDDSTFASFLATNDWCQQQFAREAKIASQEIVSVRRLDEVLNEIPFAVDRPRIYLKMDTQGYDLQVFTGASGWLDRVVALQSEVSVTPIYQGMPHLTESIATYERAGFEVAGMYPVTTEKSALRVVEFDCLMVRSDRI